MKITIQALRMLAVLTVILGVLYPLVITLAAGVVFPAQANGSLVTVNGQVVGSSLIGQGFSSDKYFQPRPSATNYGITLDSNGKPQLDDAGQPVLAASGGSNLGPTSANLLKAVQDRANAIRSANGLSADAVIPQDLLFASASGLDPHISPEAARLQVDRVAKARNLPRDRVAALVEQYVEGPQLGLFGQPRVNVLLLNVALDQVK